MFMRRKQMGMSRARHISHSGKAMYHDKERVSFSSLHFVKAAQTSHTILMKKHARPRMTPSLGGNFGTNDNSQRTTQFSLSLILLVLHRTLRYKQNATRCELASSSPFFPARSLCFVSESFFPPIRRPPYSPLPFHAALYTKAIQGG